MNEECASSVNVANYAFDYPIWPTGGHTIIRFTRTYISFVDVSRNCFPSLLRPPASNFPKNFEFSILYIVGTYLLLYKVGQIGLMATRLTLTTRSALMIATPSSSSSSWVYAFVYSIFGNLIPGLNRTIMYDITV